MCTRLWLFVILNSSSGRETALSYSQREEPGSDYGVILWWCSYDELTCTQNRSICASTSWLYLPPHQMVAACSGPVLISQTSYVPFMMLMSSSTTFQFKFKQSRHTHGFLIVPQMWSWYIALPLAMGARLDRLSVHSLPLACACPDTNRKMTLCSPGLFNDSNDYPCIQSIWICLDMLIELLRKYAWKQHQCFGHSQKPTLPCYLW